MLSSVLLALLQAMYSLTADLPLFSMLYSQIDAWWVEVEKFIIRILDFLEEELNNLTDGLQSGTPTADNEDYISPRATVTRTRFQKWKSKRLKKEWYTQQPEGRVQSLYRMAMFWLSGKHTAEEFDRAKHLSMKKVASHGLTHI